MHIFSHVIEWTKDVTAKCMFCVYMFSSSVIKQCMYTLPKMDAINEIHQDSMSTKIFKAILMRMLDVTR